MPDIKETEKKPRKLLPIIYVLDVSGSMQGERIAAVNSAMNETVEVLKEVSNDNPTAELKIGVLQFSTGAKWITDQGLIFLDDYFWTDIQAGGLTDFGSALKELNEKLSRQAFLDSPVGYKSPVIIFMSDGEPTDDYKSAIDRIKSHNKWYKVATKIAIGVGEDANLEVLKDIAGNTEAVIQVNDLESLKKLIRVVSVTASQIGSVSRPDIDDIDSVIKQTKERMGDKVETLITSESGEVSIEPQPDPFLPDLDFNSDDVWEDFSFEGF